MAAGKTIQTKDIRAVNRMRIIECIIEKQPVSRVEISECTSLNKATVSTIVKEWMDLKLLKETMLGDSTGGRKPIMLHQAEKSGYCIAVDIQMEKMRVIVTDLANKIQKSYTITYVSEDFMSNFKLLYQLLDQITQHSDPSPYGLIGIGICVRGIVDLDGVIRFIPQLKWRNIDIKVLLEERYHVPVSIDNDGNLSALAEQKANPFYKNLAVINITEVLSTGLIVDGTLVQGHHGFANSVGHHIVNFTETAQCSCGKYGCWEQYCSNIAVIRQMNQNLDKPIRSIQEFIAMVKIQDQNALEVLRQFIRFLAIGIGNIIFFLDCDVIILNSEIITSLPYIVPEILKNIVLPITQTENIVISSLGEQSAVLGASGISIRRFYQLLAGT